MRRIEPYRILLNRQWGLEDLYQFPRAFAQTYAYAYCFESELTPRDAERIDDALQSYPWRGGYSYVNIYTVLQNQIPYGERPKILSIQYSSPGWLDLVLNLDPAIKVAASVASIAGSAVVTTKAYASIQKTLHDIALERQRRKLEALNLTKAQVIALRELSNELAESSGIKRFKELEARTGDPEVAAKLLSAQYRRLKTIVEFTNKGKATLPVKGKDES